MTQEQLHVLLRQVLEARTRLALASEQYDKLYFQLWDELKRLYPRTQED